MQPFFHQVWHGPWLCTVSFIAGGLNALAAGGSFLSFPALLSVGVAPIQANATNTVALWPGQFTSILGFGRELKDHRELVLPLSAAALLGGFFGALALLRTGQSTFLALVPWLLLLAAILFAVSTPITNWLGRRPALALSPRQLYVAMFVGIVVVCFYIGYFGAGAGFLTISVLALLGVKDIYVVNALKTLAALLANGIAVVTFIARGQVLWQYCLLMMATAAVGGYVGARFSHHLSPRLLRSLVVVVGLTMAAYFFWKQA